MYQVGLLILTVPLRFVLDAIGHHLKWARQRVIKRLYIKLEPGCNQLKPAPVPCPIDPSLLAGLVPAVYRKATIHCKDLDVRLFLTSRGGVKNSNSERSAIDVVLTDSTDDEVNIKEYVYDQFSSMCSTIIKTESFYDCHKENTQLESKSFHTYRNVVLGGTFDRLHNGHKVLLSDANLRASNKLIIGVTDGPMLKRKVLWELIEPVQIRINSVANFLKDVGPGIEYSVVPITDPFGPSIEDPDIDCIIVSHETKKGGDKVNCERIKRGLKELDMYIIDLIAEPDQVFNDEPKVSSSTVRKQLLGCYSKKTEFTWDQTKPLFIVLTGGLMSKKYYIADCLKKLGVKIIDCNEIVCHYLTSNSELYQQTVLAYSKGILDNEGGVNKKFLDLLTVKFQPLQEFKKSISQYLQADVAKKISQCYNQGETVVAVETCSFVDFEMPNNVCHIWATIISQEETVKRFAESYNFTEQEALEAAVSYKSNTTIIEQSDVVFSTEWSFEFTQQQVHKAWSQLQNLLKSHSNI